MKQELPNRKTIRLPDYDYSTPGAYFVTICTKDRRNILSRIDVGTGVLDGPSQTLMKHGVIADQYIRQMDAYYDHISVDKYVIMPNHIHMLIHILSYPQNGRSGTPVPTANSTLSKFISTFKRFCNKEYGENIWQPRSYDHIIRDGRDYDDIWRYIDDNPAKWNEDAFFCE